MPHALAVIADLRQRTVSPGEIIFLEGAPAKEAYVILKGEVQVAVHDAKDNVVVINRMKAGEMFGEIGLLLPSAVRTATTMSEEGCELVIIDKSVFEKHLANADNLLRFIIEHLCRRLIAMTERARDQSPPKAG